MLPPPPPAWPYDGGTVDREDDGTSLQVRVHRHRSYAFGKTSSVVGKVSNCDADWVRRRLSARVTSSSRCANQFVTDKAAAPGQSRRHGRKPATPAQMVKAVWNDSVIAETEERPKSSKEII